MILFKEYWHYIEYIRNEKAILMTYWLYTRTITGNSGNKLVKHFVPKLAQFWQNVYTQNWHYFMPILPYLLNKNKKLYDIVFSITFI